MLSIVIAAHNEAPSLGALIDQIQQVADANGYAREIIVVDDGSTDETWLTVTELAGRLDSVCGIRLRRNFGKATALSEGFAAARGEIVVTLDGDLQDDPSEIPTLLAKIDDGADVVCGWKKVRRDAWSRVAASRIFNWLVSRITGVQLHDHNCGFKCCRRTVLTELHLYGELHRFIPVLAASIGYRVAEVPVNHRPRPHGKSRYGWSRIPKGLLDLFTVQFLTSFRHRPQHLLGSLGLLGFALGTLGLTFLTGWWCISRIELTGLTPIHLHRRPVFYLSLTAMILGSQFLAVGFLGELIVAMQRQSRTGAPVSGSERVGFDPESMDPSPGDSLRESQQAIVRRDSPRPDLRDTHGPTS